MGIIRPLPDDAIDALLRSSLIGRIACAAPEVDDGRPFLVPLAYGYDGEAVYACGGMGRKIETLRANPRASFEVDTAEAIDHWSSVICDVTYHELTDPDARAAALARVPGHEGTNGAAESRGLIVYRLVITRRSGRYERPQ